MIFAVWRLMFDQRLQFLWCHLYSQMIFVVWLGWCQMVGPKLKVVY